MDLTKSEENILEILLDSDTPLSKSGILEHAPKDKCWKDGSIHILLNSLLEKGAIHEAGFIRTGKGFGRTFAPTQKGLFYFSDLLLNISQKSQPYKIFSQLIQENVFTNEELDALEELIKLRK